MREHHLVTGEEVLEQPRLLSVPEEPGRRERVLFRQEGLAPRSEEARRQGLSGVAQARAALEAAAGRAEAEGAERAAAKAAARAGRKAA